MLRMVLIWLRTNTLILLGDLWDMEEVKDLEETLRVVAAVERVVPYPGVGNTACLPAQPFTH